MTSQQEAEHGFKTLGGHFDSCHLFGQLATELLAGDAFDLVDLLKSDVSAYAIPRTNVLQAAEVLFACATSRTRASGRRAECRQ